MYVCLEIIRSECAVCNNTRLMKLYDVCYYRVVIISVFYSGYAYDYLN